MTLFQTADRLLKRFYDLCGYIAAVFMILLAIFVLLSIATRALGTYIPGLTEYSGYSMAASSFFALAYTFRNGGHIRVAIVRNALRGKARQILELWCVVIATGFSLYLAWYLVSMTYISWRFEDRSEGGDAILLWIPQTGVAFGSVVMAICMVHTLIKAFAGHEDAVPQAAKIGD